MGSCQENQFLGDGARGEDVFEVGGAKKRPVPFEPASFKNQPLLSLYV